PFYNVPFALELRGPLDERALARALAEIVAHHAALRTRFPVLDGEPAQVIEPPFEPLAVEDLRAAPESARAAALDAFAREPFDLRRGRRSRARLFRPADERAELAINVHHIVFDGWSFEVFVDELVERYARPPDGQAAPAPLGLQYADYAAWQAEREHGAEALA